MCYWLAKNGIHTSWIVIITHLWRAVYPLVINELGVSCSHSSHASDNQTITISVVIWVWKLDTPKKIPWKKNHQFSHSRSHHLTIGFNPSHVAMFAGLVWGCREVPTFRSCGWSHFFCTNFGNQRRKGIGFPTILDSSSRKWPLTEKWGSWSPIWLDTPINCVV